MIDDNVQLIDMVKEYFSSSNDVSIELEAHDGLEGMKMIEEKKDCKDAIIMDLIMPNKDGLYVLEEMKNKNINKKVIVSTSYNAIEVIRQVSDYGVNYFILQPFELSDLEKRIIGLFSNESKGNTLDLFDNKLKISGR